MCENEEMPICGGADCFRAQAIPPTRGESKQTKGLMEHFNKTFLDEFFRCAFQETSTKAWMHFSKTFDMWQIYFNTERPHRDYLPEPGRTVMDTMLEFALLLDMTVSRTKHLLGVLKYTEVFNVC